MNGHLPITDWRDTTAQVLHVHAEFCSIDEHGDEPSIDYPGLVRELVEGGFSGYVPGEREGHAFEDVGESDSITLVREQHDLVRRAVHEAMGSAGQGR